MIRRGFWLVAGAALGVTGYRKAARLARALTGQDQAARPAAVLPAAARASLVARPARLALLPGRAVTKPGGQAATAVAQVASAAGFVRDVRDGMAEYWDLHRGGSDRTLVSRSDRASSGDGQHGCREP